MLTGDSVLICLFVALVSVATLYVTQLRVSKLKDEFDLNMSTMQGEVNHLEAVVETLESRIDAQQDGMDEFFGVLMDLANADSPETSVHHVSTEPSEFDMRIAQFREDLNTPTYEDNVAQTLHPYVYNVPHESVQDVTIKYEPEYAD